MSEMSLQETYSPTGGCFGCGPTNEKGLRIRSFVEGDEVVLRWRGEPHHQAYPGMMNGGIVGVLMDCHSNWCAAHHLMRRAGAQKPDCTVTAEFTVKLRRPTPLDQEVELRSRVTESSDDRATVETVMTAEVGGERKVTATCTGLFVAVKPGHPAYHRW